MSIKRKGTEVRQNYAINLNESFSIASDYKSKTSEEAYLEYCLGIGLPKYSSYLLANFASKLHLTLPKDRKVTSDDIIKGFEHTMSYYRSTGNHKSMLKVSDLEKLIENRQQ